MMEKSRIQGFHRLSVSERLRLLKERGLIGEEESDILASGRTLRSEEADKMVENVIGVFGLPFGIGLNFRINEKDYVVPMVVEEPSVVAALSAAAKLVRDAGGFVTTSADPVLVGQIQVLEVSRPTKAQSALLQSREEILNLANSLHPNLVARGGGATDLEVVIHPSPSGGGDMVVVHLLVNTCDAMGANLVNSMCEGVAELVGKIAEGKVFLRILSNLTDRSLVRAQATLPVRLLEGRGFRGSEVRDGVIAANEFAAVDPYRAATHNKGIMNGIDALAIATGNDWRAIEAAAHAYAARGKSYTSLTRWYRNGRGDLAGALELPIKVGTVGTSLRSNPAARVGQRILGVASAKELAEVMGAVGLAQNLAALRALVTDGIQRGHMKLQARSAAVAAGATPEMFETVVERLVESGEVKLWKAEQIVQALHGNGGTQDGPGESNLQAGFGKVILIGEHAVVYGSHAVAAPIALAVQAKVVAAGQDGAQLFVPKWGMAVAAKPGSKHPSSVQRSLGLILERMGLTDANVRIEVFPQVPRAMGLGGSAATAVAIIRALTEHFRVPMDDESINRLAYECEKLAHGTPSGIDNTMATFGRFMLFRRGDPPSIRVLSAREPIPIVIGMCGVESLTARMVAKVRGLWQKNQTLYEGLFSQINATALQAAEAIEQHDLETLGNLMNVGQGLLNALQVSCWELEELIQIARHNGALGAKLTGAGGGGSMIALCPDNPEKVAAAMRRAGYQALVTQIG